MRRPLALALVLAAGQAAAESVYVPECSDPGVGVYDVQWHGGGFVFYAAGNYDQGETLLVVDDCPRQQRLTMSVIDADIVEKEKGGALFDAVDKAVQSKQRYTLGQIAAIARKAGATVTQGRATYVSCACETYGEGG